MTIRHQTVSTWTPNLSESGPQTEEFLPIVILRGREHGRREQIDICETYERAAESGTLYARNVGKGATWTVLRRPVGAWEEVVR